MKKLPGTNRLYENEHPEIYNKINWYKDKSNWLEDFNKCICIKNITPDKILKLLNLNPTEFKNYSEYLYVSIKSLQDKRRKRSIEVRNIEKENKKTELRNLINLKNITYKNWTWKYISDLMNISVKHLRRLRYEIELEDQNQQTLRNIKTIKSRLDRYIETKRKIKEFGYNNIDKKELGNINHINKLLITYNIDNVSLFLDIFNCNIPFILQMSSFYKSGKLDRDIKYHFNDMRMNCSCWTKNIRPTDPIKRKEIINRWKEQYKILNELKQKRNIFRLIDEYKP
jgi:hypothetical protein